MSKVNTFMIRKFSKLVLEGDIGPDGTRAGANYWHRYPQRSSLALTFILRENTHIYVYHRGVRLEKIDLGTHDVFVFVQLYPSIALKIVRGRVTKRYQVGFIDEKEFGRCLEFLAASGLGVRRFRAPVPVPRRSPGTGPLAVGDVGDVIGDVNLDYGRERDERERDDLRDESQNLCSQIPQKEAFGQEIGTGNEKWDVSVNQSISQSIDQSICQLNEICEQDNSLSQINQRDQTIPLTQADNLSQLGQLSQLSQLSQVNQCLNQSYQQSLSQSVSQSVSLSQSLGQSMTQSFIQQCYTHHIQPNCPTNGAVSPMDPLIWPLLDFESIESLMKFPLQDQHTSTNTSDSQINQFDNEKNDKLVFNLEDLDALSDRQLCKKMCLLLKDTRVQTLLTRIEAMLPTE